MNIKNILIFIGGFIAGALFFYIISIRTENSEKEKLREKLMSELMNSLNSVDNKVQQVQIQYVEIKGKKGNVTLHTGMPKDSVQILVGKPDKVSLNTYGNSTHESWGYKINNKYGVPKDYQEPDLDIEFVDGKLKNVQQD